MIKLGWQHSLAEHPQIMRRGFNPLHVATEINIVPIFLGMGIFELLFFFFRYFANANPVQRSCPPALV